jgi:hypothetical protein
MLNPKILLSSLKEDDVFYHAWVAVKSIIDSGDWYVSFRALSFALISNKLSESGVKLAGLATEQFVRTRPFGR